nr:hypothetical protein [Tanacetum cinerariifolium]
MASFDYHLNPLYTIKECSSCGALYTTDYCCSNGSLVDNIICDLNKAPDSPHLHTFSSNQHHCFQCKDVLGDGEFCQRCTCMRCGSGLIKGLCLICGNNQNSLNDSLNEIPFTCDSTPNIVDDSPNVFNPPPQLPNYSYEFCGNDPYYGHDCPPQVPFTYDPEPYQAAKARYWKIPICHDDDEDYTIAITPKEPDNSLSMEDEHLDTISTTKSDEFIKSSVENLVPNPNSLIISSSSKIDYLLDEFAGELILLKSISPGIDKADCDPKEEVHLVERLLYDNSSPRPPEEFNSEYSDAIIESFSPSPIPVEDSDPFMKEIDFE